MSKGWTNIQFTDIFDIQGGTQPPKAEFISSPKKEYVRLLQIRDFGEKPVPTYIPDKSKLKKCEKADVLIARYGASVGRILTGMAGAYNVAIAKVVIPEQIDKRYMYYLLNSSLFQEPITSFQRSAQNGFNKTDLSTISLPIAPLNEQKRIVKKLDAIFEKINQNKARLERIPQLLKDFRQQVLQAAVTGELTKEWREENEQDCYEELSGYPENDFGWKVLKAADACIKVQSGSTPKNSPFTAEGDVPYLKVYNIQDQKIAFDYKPQFISNEIHTTGSMKRSIVKPNDVLMNIVGPPLGKIAIVTNQYSEWNINQAIVLFRPKHFLLTEFLYYSLCGGREIDRISFELKGSAGQQNISLTQSRNFILDIPSIEEQKEIVSKVEELFAFADKIEANYHKAKTKIEQLPQTILAKAFRGELVEQDPNDEPASELLAKIKEAKKALKKK